MNSELIVLNRDGNRAGWGRVSLSHTYPRRKNSSLSPYPKPTGIKLLSHPHPHRVTDIISYPYPYPFYYFNINFYKIIKITVKETLYYQIFNIRRMVAFLISNTLK